MNVNYVRYGALYFAAMVVLAGVSVMMTRVLGFGFPSGAASIIPPMAAALFEGQQAGRAGARPSGRALWAVAFAMTGVAVLINGAIAAIFLSMAETRALLSQVPLRYFTGIAALLIAAVLLVNRFFFGIGLKSGLAKGTK
ncbi:ABZJ_00895 family protein [Allosediminivita pacifica]|uniref:Uncharacterized protein n=1 Tax=Allosediminivita pacifica TaxID=1267769 RepID=A0A2T6AB32_9RHOB|nr:ABZJ_00895 family protein [Allosediminivita pacifica]PTX41035.1 hypothetical protein C8N44_1338 [Allosediminivita pacifica]GGB26120.1 hypothetical protein GCM10011324_39910 [Allosediminivita pacifica]